MGVKVYNNISFIKSFIWKLEWVTQITVGEIKVKSITGYYSLNKIDQES